MHHNENSFRFYLSVGRLWLFPTKVAQSKFLLCELGYQRRKLQHVDKQLYIHTAIYTPRNQSEESERARKIPRPVFSLPPSLQHRIHCRSHSCCVGREGVVKWHNEVIPTTRCQREKAKCLLINTSAFSYSNKNIPSFFFVLTVVFIIEKLVRGNWLPAQREENYFLKPLLLSIQQNKFKIY